MGGWLSDLVCLWFYCDFIGLVVLFPGCRPISGQIFAHNTADKSKFVVSCAFYFCSATCYVFFVIYINFLSEILSGAARWR